MRRKGEIECTEERKDSCGKFLRDWIVLSKGVFPENSLACSEKQEKEEGMPVKVESG